MIGLFSSLDHPSVAVAYHIARYGDDLLFEAIPTDDLEHVVAGQHQRGLGRRWQVIASDALYELPG